MAYSPLPPLGNTTMSASLPVTIASNQTAFPVTLTSTTITGTIAVTQSGTWDEVGINDSGNSITIDNATLSVVGGGAEATALRVTIASDSTGVLSIDDNGSSITVDGTVTANLAAGTNNIGDVDVLTVPADPFGVNADAASASGSISAKLRFIASTGIPITGTVTVGSHAVTNAGTFVVQENGAALTALQLLDDTVATLGTTTYTEASTKGNIIGAVRRDADTTLVDTTNEVAPLQVDSRGALKVEVFSGETLPVSLTSTTITGTVAATQSGTWILGANSGVDIGDVTINNASGASAVNIQDGGNSITIDGTVTANAGTGTFTIAGAVTNTVLSVVGGGTEATAQRVTIANDSTGVLSIDDNGGSITVDGTITEASGATIATNTGNTVTSLQIMDDWDNAASDGASVSGDTAHDAIDAGEPVKIGARAISHGTNPTAVAANDRTNLYANLAGIPFVMGGHPNIISAEYNTTTAATDDNILPAIAGGTIYVITGISVMISNATTVDTSVRIGFGTATLTASGASQADAVSKIILSHPGLAAGSGIVKGVGAGIVGIGGDGEELRITCSAPTTGSLFVQVDYYTITS